MDAKLLKSPQDFYFFQWLRLLFLEPGLDVYFKNHIGFEFPVHEVFSVILGASLREGSLVRAVSLRGAQRRGNPDIGIIPRMITIETTFLGFLGAQGLLPDPFKLDALESAARKDFLFGDFLNIFHHRWVSLLYESWQRHYFFIAHERRQEDQPFAQALLSIAKLAGPRDDLFLKYSGLFVTRSAASLQAMIADYFAVPVKIISFAGRWINLEPDQQTQMGLSNSNLGTNLQVSDRHWFAQNKFLIEIGPLNYKAYQSWIPGGDARRVLSEILKAYAGLYFDYELKVSLMTNQIPTGGLGNSHGALGWNTWLL
jgi:type VI secretion system protein ImpH